MRRFSVRYSPLAILFALWLLFFWRYFVPGPDRVTFPAGDFTYQFFVFRDIAYRALASGHLPLWANCFFAGYPFHADPQSQLFYPPIWLSFGALKLMGFGHFPLFALTLEATAHYLLISVFLYLFLRAEIGAPNNPASGNQKSEITNLQSEIPFVLGALVFTYGGYLTGYPPLQTAILETVTWLPLILLAFRRLAQSSAINHPSPIDRAEFRRLAAAALFLAIAFFAGHPQTFLFVFYLSLAYFVHRAAVHRRPWRWTLSRIAVIGVLLFGLSAVQLLPQAQFLMLSTRASLGYDALSGGFPLGAFVHLFFPDLVWSSLYAGVLPLALAAAALAFCLRTRLASDAMRSSVVFWFAAALIGLILSFGANAAGYPLAYWLVPGYRLFRGQERAALVVSFSLAALASFGASVILGSPSRPARLLARRAAGVALWLLPLALALMVIVGLVVPASPENEGLRTLPARVTLLAFGLGLTALAMSAAAVPIARRALFSPAEGQGVRAGGVLLVALAALELFTANARTNQAAAFDPYPYLALLDPIRADSDPFFRVQDDAQMQGHFACGYGLKEWSGISPIRPAAWAEFDQRAPESLRWKVIGMKYLITWKNGALTREDELPPAERAAEGPSPAGDPANTAKVYRMFEIPRRAWLVYQTRTAPDADSIYAALQTPDFDPFTTAVTRNYQLPISNLQPPTSNLQPLVIDDYAGRLVLSSSSPSPALLVVSEAYYPGWTAAVNGQPAPVVEADAFLLSVPVPAGESTIVLDYRPASLIIGAVVSTLMWVVLAAAFFPLKGH